MHSSLERRGSLKRLSIHMSHQWPVAADGHALHGLDGNAWHPGDGAGEKARHRQHRSCARRFSKDHQIEKAIVDPRRRSNPGAITELR